MLVRQSAMAPSRIAALARARMAGLTVAGAACGTFSVAWRYGITGPPGDCAVTGACHLMPEAPQLLLSGVRSAGKRTLSSRATGR